MLTMDMSLPGATRGPWLACRGLRGAFPLGPEKSSPSRAEGQGEPPSLAGVARLTRDGGLAGSLTAFLGPGKVCG